MKKGLTMTLLTVAIAMLGFQAMAMAPTISKIPSPIVGDGDITAANTFVYPDAIDLDQYGSDDSSPTASILWSYEQSGTRYLLNGVQPISTSDPDSMMYNPAAKNIAASDLDPITGGDTNPRTVTVRNQELSPLGGATTPQTPGILTGQTGTITLTASDGSSYSQQDLVIYTEAGAPDSLSPRGGTPAVKVYEPPIGNSTQAGFLTSKVAGTVTFGTASGQLCMDTTPMGDNWGFWYGLGGDVPVTANSVYDIQMEMTSSNASPGATPFWDMALDNNNNTGTGMNLYGMDTYFLSNEGGANSATTTAKTFHMVWAPLPVLSSSFNDAAFNSTVGDKIKGRFIFRVMDIWNNGNAGIRSDIQSGTICLKKLTVMKYNVADTKVVGPALYNVGPSASTPVNFDQSTGTGDGNFTISELLSGATTVTIDGGAIKIAPANTGQLYTTFNVGDAHNTDQDIPGQADNFPVPFDAGTIYRTSYTIVAADANSVTNPPDCFYINNDMPSYEVISQNFITCENNKCAMPKLTPTTYVTYYHTNFGTNSTQGAAWKKFRPAFIMANVDGIGGKAPNPVVTNNSGAIKITNIKVEKVTLK